MLSQVKVPTHGIIYSMGDYYICPSFSLSHQSNLVNALEGCKQQIPIYTFYIYPYSFKISIDGFCGSNSGSLSSNSVYWVHCVIFGNWRNHHHKFQITSRMFYFCTKNGATQNGCICMKYVKTRLNLTALSLLYPSPGTYELYPCGIQQEQNCVKVKQLIPIYYLTYVNSCFQHMKKHTHCGGGAWQVPITTEALTWEYNNISSFQVSKHCTYQGKYGWSG